MRYGRRFIRAVLWAYMAYMIRNVGQKQAENQGLDEPALDFHPCHHLFHLPRDLLRSLKEKAAGRARSRNEARTVKNRCQSPQNHWMSIYFHGFPSDSARKKLENAPPRRKEAILTVREAPALPWILELLKQLELRRELQHLETPSEPSYSRRRGRFPCVFHDPRPVFGPFF